MSYRAFETAVASLAKQLPEKNFQMNLCQNRVLFTLGLAAAAWRRQTVLLPPARSPAVLEDLQQDYRGTFILTDDWIQEQMPPSLHRPASKAGGWTGNRTGNEPESSTPPSSRLSEGETDAGLNSLELIAFTSGSTGTPQAWPRSWRMLRYCAGRALASLNLGQRSYAMIATTPPQHMYGLETSIVWPLCSNLLLTDERPFYPEDIRRAVKDCPFPVVLVSTPVHLRACLNSPGTWHNLAAILSSTSPLDSETAFELEEITGAPVLELYGSTETLSFAWRCPSREKDWRPYQGVTLACHDDHTVLDAPWLADPVALPDLFQPNNEGHFRSLGRRGDLIKIAGKRHSLAELNRILLSIDGIHDGCFYQTDHGRLGALVVSNRGKDEIRLVLRQHVDEVFLPRPLHFVNEIPRNDSGKIVRSELKSLLENLHPGC